MGEKKKTNQFQKDSSKGNITRKFRPIISWWIYAVEYHNKIIRQRSNYSHKSCRVFRKEKKKDVAKQSDDKLTNYIEQNILKKGRKMHVYHG